MTQLRQDLRYGWRMLLKHRGFTVVAVISLALGIGANTTIFSIANTVLLRPLPVEDPDRLVRVFTTFEGGDQFSHSTYPDYLDLRDGNDAFAELVAYFYFPMGLRGGERAEVVLGQIVTANYFSALGVEPVMGRGFLPSEESVAGADAVAVLSHASWMRRFDADPDIVGRTVFINSHPFTVVGVAPEGFTSPNVMFAPEVWVPVTMVGQVLPYPIELDDRTSTWLLIAGRLAPGVELAQAQAAMDLAMANILREHPEDGDAKGMNLVAMDRARIGLKGTTDDTAQLVTMLMFVVGLVLLIACFNVANLHLARATGRQAEMALRLSLGASRGRILRQLLVESVLLALLAAVVGLLMGSWALDVVDGLTGELPFPVEIDFGIDARVLGFTLALSLATAIAFGLTPALHTLRTGQFPALRDQAVSLSGGRKRSRLQRALVVGQVALSLVLLVGAGLLLRSLGETRRIDPGFDVDNGLVVPIDLGFGRYSEDDGRAFYERLLDRIGRLPGIQSASLAAGLPLGELGIGAYVEIDGYVPAPDEPMSFDSNIVGPGYFETMGIPIVSGRAIDERDRAETRPVVVINEAMARRFWPNETPVGRTMHVYDEEREIVGIIPDGKYDRLDEAPQPHLIVAMRQQAYIARFNLVVRTEGDPELLIEPVRREIGAIDADLPLASIITLRQHLQNSTSMGDAFVPAAIVGGFSLIALLLAMVGIFGVTSYVVSRRTHEIGLRLAVGAGPVEILRLVLGDGFRMAVAGIGIGLAIALATTHVLTSFLYGVSPLEPIVFVIVPSALAFVALLACYIPARRASRVDPAVALKVE